MSIFKRRKRKRQRSKNELDAIAGEGVSSIRLYSWNSVYDAYRAAGLSEEEATAETNKRVVTLG